MENSPETLRWTVAPDSSDMLADFASEARQLLDHAETACLDLDADPTQAAIATAFRAFHTIKGVAGFLDLGVLASLAHQIESVLSDVRDGATPPPNFADLVLGAIDRARACIVYALHDGQGEPPDVFTYLATLPKEPLPPRDGEPPAPRAEEPPAPAAIVAPPAPPPPMVTTMLPRLDLDEAIAALVVPTPDDVEAAPPILEVVAAPVAPTPSAPAPAAPAPAAERGEDAAIRVDIGKMDHIIDLVGELAIAQAQVAAHPDLARLATSPLVRSLAQVTRVVRELQRASLAMRMVTIKNTFDRMARIARDTARTLGKAVTFVTDGAHTELDRTMVEAIYDPLVHLVRNAIDHGIEGRIERVRRGKPEAGTLTLRAFHKAGHIVIEITDDGAGLNRERILARAKSRGLVSADARPTDEEIDLMIFLPGFSTAEQVTSVSGRGVGMDVVKTNIERVRGRVEIVSRPGHGSTFRLQLPLTLAIVDGLLLGLGDDRYVLPTTYIRDVFRPTAAQITSVQGRGEMVKVRGKLYPIVRLAQQLGAGDPTLSPQAGVLIMVDDGQALTCLLVDRLMGKQEVVVKGLGAMFARIPGVAGGAILGDGRIALILDVPTLLHPKSLAA